MQVGAVLTVKTSVQVVVQGLAAESVTVTVYVPEPALPGALMVALVDENPPGPDHE
jgi:hypothetical protein